jgi:hypothetical protein
MRDSPEILNRGVKTAGEGDEVRQAFRFGGIVCDLGG